MKSQKGVTLLSLVIYVIVMTVVIGIMSFIINNFYKNINNYQGDLDEVIKFSKFNNYFLKEIKTENNNVEKIDSNYVLFSSGNSFSLSNNIIYYNNIQVCDGVKKFEIKLGENGDGVNNTIVHVTLNFDNYGKSMNYKIENIY